MPETREDAWERERLLESLEAYRRGLSDAPLLRKWGFAQKPLTAQKVCLLHKKSVQNQCSYVD